jgi:gluconolactonase
MIKLHITLLIFALFITGFSKLENQDQAGGELPKTIGQIEKFDDALDKIINEDASIEVLADSFLWSEGPVWIDQGNCLLFSDVPANIIYRWSEKEGLSTYLQPSGFTGDDGKGEGSNGLLLDSELNLIICQHGDRRVAKMDASLENPISKFSTIASQFNGKNFNSPNDAAYYKNGDLYFTDPPYGLEKREEDPAKEIPFSGVYKVDKKGNVTLLDNQLRRPNGIAFSPDWKKIYVANSDWKNAIIKVYDVNRDGILENGRVFFDCTSLQGEGVRGLPDGMKVNSDGVVFATGPGGVLVLDKEGKHIGTINPGVAVANVAIGGDGYLYLTSHMYLTRVKLL